MAAKPRRKRNYGFPGSQVSISTDIVMNLKRVWRICPGFFGRTTPASSVQELWSGQSSYC